MEEKKKTFTFLPKSGRGAAACWLALAFGVLIGVFFLMTGVFGQRGGETIFSNLWLTVPMLAACGCAIAAAAAGISATANGERSVLVFLSILVGVLMAVAVVFQLF